MSDADDKIKDLAKKTWYQKVGDFLAPGKLVQADPSEYQSSGPSQYDEDMKLPKEERLKKVQKGFLGY